MNALALANAFAALASLQVPLSCATDVIEQPYPSLSNEVVVTGAAGAWTKGNWQQLLPDVGVNDFIVTGIHVAAVTGIHQVNLGIGAGGSEETIARLVVTGTGMHRITPVRIPGSSRVAALTASKAGGAQTLSCFLVGIPLTI